MFDILSEGFRKATGKIQGKTSLSEENISPALNEIRRSLLEADVEYSVAKTFLNRVREKSLGQQVSLRAGKGANKQTVTAGSHFVKICKEELEALMGPVETELSLPDNRLASVMMVGLQGTGKTTTTGKLARYLMRAGRKPLLVAADIYRPAAVEQLKVLGERLGTPVYHVPEARPVEICKTAPKKAMDLGCDTLLFDTAGRLTIDDELMQELDDIKGQCKPDNILLVCDAMMGQDAVNTARAFHERLKLSGVVMTKLDGDARGGAALSIKEVTGAPIKFLGMGEGLDRLEEFRPEGLASRILGMGDIVGLMEDFERVSTGDKEEEAMRMLSGQFNFKDFYGQISMIQNMGPLKDIIAKLPVQNLIPKDASVDDKELGRIKSMIDSMTEKERLNPDLLNQQRVRRIAGGSGRSIQAVQQLLSRFKSMRSVMGSLGKNPTGGMMGRIPGMGALSKMNQLRKMSGAMGGMPLMPPMGEGPDLTRRIDRDKLRKARRAQKKSRKQNRKK